MTFTALHDDALGSCAEQDTQEAALLTHIRLRLSGGCTPQRKINPGSRKCACEEPSIRNYLLRMFACLGKQGRSSTHPGFHQHLETCIPIPMDR